MKATFVELPAFERHRAKYLDDAAFSELQSELMRNPEKVMTTGAKTKATRVSKRDLFNELSEGMTALAEARGGKRTLRTHVAQFKPAPEVSPAQLLRVRKQLKLSRALFAGYLRTNIRTLENWEQGRAKPNAQAALLINMVRRYPDTVERLAAI